MDILQNINFVYDDENSIYLNSKHINNSSTTYNIENQQVELNVVNKDDVNIKQSYYHILSANNYKIFLFSVIFINNKNKGFTSRVGLFDKEINKEIDQYESGVYLEVKDYQLYFILKNKNKEHRINQTCFNYDTLNGLGKSMILLNDFTQINTFSIEFSNIQTNSIKLFYYCKGQKILLHKLTLCGSNYILKSLPIRFEISKDTDSIDTGKLSLINASFYTTEKYQIQKLLKSFYLNNIQITCGLSTNPIISFKLKNKFCRAVIKNFNYNVHISTQDPIVIQLYKNIDTTWFNTLSWTGINNTMLEYVKNTEEVNTTNAQLLHSSFLGIKLANLNSSMTSNQNYLSSNIEGQSDIFTITVKGIKPSKIMILISFEWYEYY